MPRRIELQPPADAERARFEEWMPIARRIVKGEYLPPLKNVFDKEEESRALAVWLASLACGE